MTVRSFFFGLWRGLDALREVRASGKKVIAYGTEFTQERYYLAAQADEVYLDPMGFVLLTGYDRYPTYLKGALDKLGVDINVFRVGAFKSAVEPFTRTGMSAEDREESRSYLNALWSSYQEAVTRARKLPSDALAQYVGSFAKSVPAAGGDAGQQPRRQRARVRADLSGAAGAARRRQAPRGVDERLRGFRRLLHRGAGRRDLGEPGDAHRLDRHIRDRANPRQDARQGRRERRRCGDDAALGPAAHRSSARRGSASVPAVAAQPRRRRGRGARGQGGHAAPRADRRDRPGTGVGRHGCAPRGARRSHRLLRRCREGRGAAREDHRLRGRLHRARAHLGAAAGAAAAGHGAGVLPGRPGRARPEPAGPPLRPRDARGGEAQPFQRAEPPVRLLLLRSAIALERRPVEDHLAGLPRPHGLEALEIFLHREVMGDYGLELQSALQQARHFVPGLEHLAGVDAMEGS